MRLFRPRPRVSVFIPPTVLPGSAFDVQIVLDSSRSIPIDYVDVTLTGTEQCQSLDRSAERIIGPFVARVSGPQVLKEGRTEFVVRFVIPADAPPSFVGRSARVDYLLYVRVSIPSWLDRLAHFVLWVSAPPIPIVDSPGVVFSSRPSGPEAHEPHLECSLASTTLRVGGELSGSVALSNVRYNRYRSVDLSLVSREYYRSPGEAELKTAETTHYAWTIPVSDDLGEAEALPFRVRLPSNIPPTLRSVCFELQWIVALTARFSFRPGVGLQVPVVVVPGDPVSSGVSKTAPSVGQGRVQAVWSLVAENLGMQVDGDSLRARVGTTDVQVWRDHRGREGVFLDAELRFPPVHLGLEGGAKGGKVLQSPRVKLNAEQWVVRERVHGREAAQVRAFFEALGPALADLELDLVQDDLLRVGRRESGMTAGPLDAFVRAVLTLARRLDQARAAIPIPTALAHAKDCWLALAELLSAELVPGDMRIAGQFQQSSVTLTTDWKQNGEPLRTLLVVRGAHSLRKDYHVVWHKGEDTSVVRNALPPAAGDQLLQAMQGGESLSIGGDGLELSLPAPLADAKGAAERIRTLCEVVVSLRSSAGPYR